MSEAPLRGLGSNQMCGPCAPPGSFGGFKPSLEAFSPCVVGRGLELGSNQIQGYLAHEKLPLPRTLQ